VEVETEAMAKVATQEEEVEDKAKEEIKPANVLLVVVKIVPYPPDQITGMKPNNHPNSPRDNLYKSSRIRTGSHRVIVDRDKVASVGKTVVKIEYSRHSTLITMGNCHPRN
jgi:hypothetical protein